MILWLCIAATAAVSFAVKAAGPALLGRRDLPAGARSVVALFAPVLLAALVIAHLLGHRWSDTDLTVVAGLAVAVVARLLRASHLVAITCAIATTALLRLWW